jgi:hypothetical protein
MINMSEVKKVILYLARIIRKPFITVRSIDMISYDRDILDKIFIIVTAIIGILMGLIIESNNIGIALLFGILCPIIITIGFYISVLYFYIILKVVGKEISINYDILKVLFKVTTPNNAFSRGAGEEVKQGQFSG